MSLRIFGQYFDREPAYENDANAAAMAELKCQSGNAVYLSLSNTVGGAVYINQELYPGDHFRSAEFGHMTLIPGESPATAANRGVSMPTVLPRFYHSKAVTAWRHSFRSCPGEAKAAAIWDQYLEHLAVTIANLRMSFDCDIILGGYVGVFWSPM